MWKITRFLWCVYYVSLRSQKFPSHFLQRNKKQKMSRLQTQKHRVLIHICLDKACKSGRHCYFWMYFEFIFECLYTQEFFSHAWVEKLNISWLFLSNPILFTVMYDLILRPNWEKILIFLPWSCLTLWFKCCYRTPRWRCGYEVGSKYSNLAFTV